LHARAAQEQRRDLVFALAEPQPARSSGWESMQIARSKAISASKRSSHDLDAEAEMEAAA